MTKSQNTKKDLTSEHLTEQWKKGKLPSGYYYVKNEFGNIFPSDYSESYDSINDVVIKDFFTEVSEIKEVLAPVPSYEEWEQLQNWADFTNDYHELRKKLEIAEYEIAQLKELLKECKEWFNWYHIDTGTGKEYIESWHKKGHEIHKKIDEALK